MKQLVLDDFAWVRLGTIRDVRTRTKRPAPSGLPPLSEGFGFLWAWKERVERGDPRIASMRVATSPSGYSVTISVQDELTPNAARRLLLREELKGMEPGIPFEIKLEGGANGSLRDASALLRSQKKLHTPHSSQYKGPWYEPRKVARSTGLRQKMPVGVSFWPRHVRVAYVEIMNRDEIADALESFAGVL